MPWVKGQSGNPGGRPRLMEGARRKAQAESESALNYVVRAAKGKIKNISPLRMQACISVLKLAGASFSAEGHDAMEDRAGQDLPVDQPTPDLETVAGCPALPLN